MLDSMAAEQKASVFKYTVINYLKHIHVYMHTHLYIYMCIYICIDPYIYIYVNTYIFFLYVGFDGGRAEGQRL